MLPPPQGIITAVQQVCVVVRDLRRTIEEYVTRAGIGPWAVYTYAPPDLRNCRVRGREVPYSMRLALAWTNGFMWEVIEPLEGPSIYAEHLETHGEGLHHVLVAHAEHDYAAALAELAKRGVPPLMEGHYKGTDFAYVDSEGPLKLVLELVKRPNHPGYRRPDPEYWYPFTPAVPFT